MEKRKYREKISRQKGQSIKKYDRDRKQKSDGESEQSSANQQVMDSSFKSKQILYNHAFKARRVMPDKPAEFAEIVTHICANSPRKRKALEIGLARKKRKLDICDICSKKPRDVAQQLLKRSIKYRNGKSARPTVKHRRGIVGKFYFREDISKALPNKRYATKHGPGYLMQVSLKSAYLLFKKEHPDIKVGFTTFTLLRPKNVRLISKTHWQYCVCTVCHNVKNKVLTLNAAAMATKKYDLKVKDDLDLLNIVMCAKSESERYHRPECISGTCSKCRDQVKQRLQNHYESLNDYVCSWNHWERVCDKDGKKRKKLICKRGSVKDAILELAWDLEKPLKNKSFQVHRFTADWQTRQYLALKETLPERSALMIFDFGRNRPIKHQEESKDAGYSAMQITVHPVVMYYKMYEEGSMLVRDSLIFMSDDIHHDHVAVKHFLNASISFLTEERKLSLDTVFVYSDGCSAQYKGAKSVASLSKVEMHVEWNFFGSEHGKGEADGEVGIVNKTLDNAIIGTGVVLNNAAEVVDWCEENISFDEPGSKRHFQLAVDPSKGNDMSEDPELPGIRSLHHIANMGEPYVVKARKLTCYCRPCSKGQHSQCENIAYVGEMETRNVITTSSKESLTASVSTSSKKSVESTTHKKPAAAKKLTVMTRSKTSVNTGSKKTDTTANTVTTATKPAVRTSSKKQITVDTSTKKDGSIVSKKSVTTDTKPAVLARSKKPVSTMSKPAVKTSSKNPVTSDTKSTVRAGSKKMVTMKQAVRTHSKMPVATATKPSGDAEETPVSRTRFFKAIQNRLSSCADYDDLQIRCIWVAKQLEQKTYKVENKTPSMLSEKATIDSESKSLPYSVDASNVAYYPAVVPADGDCLAHALGCFSNMGVEETRVRMTFEAVKYEHVYQDHDFLKDGLEQEEKNLPLAYALYSENHIPATVYTPAVVCDVYQKEVLSCAKKGTYMGIWQLHQLSSVLQREIISVYPSDRGLNVRQHLNRCIRPRCDISHEPAAAILWTSTRNKEMTIAQWVPNHFAPLLPVTTQPDFVKQDVAVEKHDEELHPEPEFSCHLLDDNIFPLLSDLPSVPDHLPVFAGSPEV